MEEGKSAVVDWSLLPQDLLWKILTCVPFESLSSCRKVCKEWHRITYEPSFIAQHCNQTRTISGYFIQGAKLGVYSSNFIPFTPLPTSIPPPSLGFLPKGTQILSSTYRGLLCCESPGELGVRPPRYCVCKPATKQFIVLPNPRTRYNTRNVAIVASASGILHFKIVRLSDSRRDFRHMICEIFDSRTWRWRRYKEEIPYLIWKLDPNVEIDDVVHWLDADNKHIFTFDIVKETWRLIPLPEWNDEEKLFRDRKLLVVCEGRLCLVRVRKNEELEIWTMVDNDVGRWRIESLVQLEEYRGCVRDLYTHQFVFLTRSFEATWFDTMNRKVTRMCVNHVDSIAFKFESDLIPCSLDARIDVQL